MKEIARDMLALAIRTRKIASHMRLRDIVARELGIAILSGKFRPGDSIVGDVEARDLFQVSRSSYREAIKILSAKGLVRAKTKSGTRVCPRNYWRMLDPDILAWSFERSAKSNDLEGLFELRQIVEPSVAALAASRRTLDQLETLNIAIAKMNKYSLEMHLGREARLAFHVMLLEAARNPYLTNAAHTIQAAAAVIWEHVNTTTFQQENSISAHIRVYDAVAARDTECARHAMCKLIEADFQYFNGLSKRQIKRRSQVRED